MKTNFSIKFLFFIVIVAGYTRVGLALETLDNYKAMIPIGKDFCQRHLSDLYAEEAKFDDAAARLGISALKELFVPQYKKYAVLSIRDYSKRYAQDVAEYQAALAEGKINAKEKGEEVYKQVFGRYDQVAEDRFAEFLPFFGKTAHNYSWAKNRLPSIVKKLPFIGDITSDIDAAAAYCNLADFFNKFIKRKIQTITDIKQGNQQGLEQLQKRIVDFQTSLKREFAAMINDNAWGGTRPIPCIADTKNKTLKECSIPPVEPNWPSFNTIMNVH